LAFFLLGATVRTDQREAPIVSRAGGSADLGFCRQIGFHGDWQALLLRVLLLLFDRTVQRCSPVAGDCDNYDVLIEWIRKTLSDAYTAIDDHLSRYGRADDVYEQLALYVLNRQ
jgi:hypothetical protein